MAKKKVVHIDVVVDDKGTTKKIAVDAKALGGQLDKTAKSSKNAQKQTKGLGQQSANGTKNFSKMSQGISGGLVPAYATLAAQIFAVSAAFQFLQSASDYRNLIQAQEVYGAIVGTNFAGITKALQEATNGQLKYQEAASATAIGTAAGLSSTQLKDLATAANNASIALGRNLTDSFNRLIRGTTKAEPELLDELGIILRLKPATEEYARSIGVAAESLNAFQRTQAVTNFVVEEANKKFGKIGEIMDKDAYAVAQFTKSFDDLVNTIKEVVVGTLTPAFQFLTKNTMSLFAALGLFALPITKSMLPAMDEWAKKSKTTSKAAGIAFAKSKAKLGEQVLKTKELAETQKNSISTANKYSKSLEGKGKAGGRDGFSFLTGQSKDGRAQANAKRILENAEKQVKKSQTVLTGTLAGFNKKQVEDLRRSYDIRTAIAARSAKQTAGFWRVAGARMKVAARGVGVAWAGTFKLIQAAGVGAVKLIDKAFKFASWVGMGLLLFDLGKMAYEAMFGTKEVVTELSEEIGKVSQRATELTEFLTNVNEVRSEGLLDLGNKVTNLGNAMGEINIHKFIDEINSLQEMEAGSKAYTELQETLALTATQIEILEPEFKGLVAAVLSGNPITDAAATAYRKLGSELQEYGVALANLPNLQKQVNTDLSAITGSISQSPIDRLKNSLEDLGEAQVTAQEGQALQHAKNVKDRAKLMADERKKLQDFQNSREFRNPRNENVRADNKVKLDAMGAEFAAISKATTAEAEKDAAAVIALQKKIDFNKAFQAELESSSKDIKSNEDKILTIKEKVAKIDRTNNTFAGKRAQLIIGEQNAEAKILSIKNQQIVAEANFNAAKKANKGIKEDSQEMKDAQRLLDSLGKELTIAQALKQIEIDRRESASKRIDMSEALLKFDEKRLDLSLKQVSAQKALRQAEAGLGKSAGEGSIAKGREIREARIALNTADIAAAQNEVNRAKKHGIELGKLGENASETEVLNQVKTLRNAESRLKVLRDLQTEFRNSSRLVVLNSQSLTKDLQLRQQGFSLDASSQAFNEKINAERAKGTHFTQAQIDLMYEEHVAQEGLNTLIDAQTRLRDGLTSSLTDGLDGLISGTMTVKQAFANMATSVLKMISRIIAEMLVARLIMSAFGGPMSGLSTLPIQAGQTGSTFQGPPVGRYGGIMKGYSEGGIARGRNAGYPAILHGTEAVVPLPNGNSIPVEMRNGGGGTNNIGITINIDGNNNAQSEQTGGSGNQAAAIGKLVAGVVQDELQKQKRPGGILSPYGAA